MKQEIKIRDLEDVRAVFDSLGVRLFVCYGALLGMFRDGKLIEHDDDIDLVVIDDIDHKTRKALGWKMIDLGFRPQGILSGEGISFNVYGRMEPLGELGYSGTEKTGIIVMERNFHFTIFFFQKEFCEKHKEDEYVCIPKLGAYKLISSPARFYEKPGEIKIGGKKYLTPGPIKKYLEYSYINWKDRNGRDHSPLHNKEHPN